MNARGLAAPPRLYAIADADALAPRTLPDAVAEIARAGVPWIQLRAKGRGSREFLRWIDASAERLHGTAAQLWIDDRADLAAIANARSDRIFGVHVGQRDLPPHAVRQVVGDVVAIGLSTHNEAQLLAADRDTAVDLIAIGPIFPTRSKDRPDPLVGLDFVRWARSATRKPLVAIGGLERENLAAVLAAGADRVVVLGAICRPPAGASIGDACRDLLAAVAEQETAA